ncbi:cytochrome c oxidase assembly protein subunit 15 [Novimethylophilus kurashikiensis]|uniref:Cytochrome c oxidase assembly protein subunit 15 n=1 Tax=Novimethylophilus kurashikiensis TaxID=1825523 RepID=A0A2R5FHD4_9PROT|nr:COX15/CtaA family protein [Novimethylophilus kurashikiensis]GBG15531.1 cytochrome c oxidase assembly protein subunit 15 [Novimethylophilus kurashikiensis]
MQAKFRWLVLGTAALALCVVVLGAFVRLSDAGLGCPDWPGCYGHMAVPQADAALQAFPQKPLEAHKAWKEMVHRYFAGTLGLLIGGIAIASWRGKGRLPVTPVIPTVLVGLVLFQAALGMWTVTLLLKPVIVSLHLLGGMTTMALLMLLASLLESQPVRVPEGVKRLGILALLLLVGQIVLGGWTSSNYAALACTEFPECHGSFWPAMDFGRAFHLIRELGLNADGTQLSSEALTAIHMTHRVGALVVFLALGWFGSRLLVLEQMRSWGRLLLGLLTIQVALGISNVLLSLQLPIAVAHNAGAALLLATMVVINSKTIRGDAS